MDDRLVELTLERHGVVVDPAYAGSGNLAGAPVYGNRCCLIHRDAEAPLAQAAALAVLCGLRLKVWDAYRPSWAQARLWQVLPDRRYVASVEVGSHHTRGVAVDVTLVDGLGRDLDMGTAFDTMEERARHFHPGLPPEVQRNRAVLLALMTRAGFQPSGSEWWHYQLPNAGAYPLLEDDRVLPATPVPVP